MFSKKISQKLLKWPKYRYYSDRFLQILKSFEKENFFFLDEGLFLENFEGVQSYSFRLFNYNIK